MKQTAQFFQSHTPSNGLLETPAGLHVPVSAYHQLVKSEAKAIAKADKMTPGQLFSRNMLASNMIAYGAREKPMGTPSFEHLYLAEKKSFIDRILIRARTDQMKMVWERALSDKDIGFKIVHDRHKDPDYEVTDDDMKRCRAMEEMMNNPTPVDYLNLYPHNVRPHNSLKDFIARMVRAELIIDRKVLYRYKRRNGKGYAAFHWLPGATIRPVHEGLREFANKYQGGKMNERTLELAYQRTGFDLTNSAYVQLIDGEIVKAFTSDEISLHVANPSDELDRFGYGESRLEISLDLSSTLIMAWSYNREIFNTNYPDTILSVIGDYDKGGLEEFKEMIYKEAGGVRRNQRLPIIPGEDGFKVEAHKLRDNPKDMLFDNMIRMLVALKCAAYGAHPTIINFSVDSPGAGGLFGHNPSDEIEFSKEHGLKPALRDLCDWLTEAIVKPSEPDLRLILTGIDEEDEKEALEMRLDRGKSHITRNQMRKEEGEDVIGDENDPDNPYNYPNDAPIATYLTAIASAKQMAQQDAAGDEDDKDPDEYQEEEQEEAPEGEEEQEEFQEPDQEPEEMQKSQSGTKFLRLRIV